MHNSTNAHLRNRRLRAESACGNTLGYSGVEDAADVQAHTCTPLRVHLYLRLADTIPMQVRATGCGHDANDVPPTPARAWRNRTW